MDCHYIKHTINSDKHLMPEGGETTNSVKLYNTKVMNAERYKLHPLHDTFAVDTFLNNRIALDQKQLHLDSFSVKVYP